MSALSRTRHNHWYVALIALAFGALLWAYHVASKWPSGVDGGDAEAASRPALRAMFSSPTSVTLDDAGNLYIADMVNHRIRRVDAKSGDISTVVGDGVDGPSEVGTRGAAASIQQPYGVTVDAFGHLYVAECEGNRIRQVDLSTGQTRAIAGRGWGEGRFSGDGADARKADLNAPESLATAPNGDVYIADTFNQRVRRLRVATGIIDTVATLDSAVSGVAVDAAGHLWVAAGHKITKITLATGAISLVAGTGKPGFRGDGGDARKAELNEPRGIAVDSTGNLYVTDTFNNRIRKVDATTGIISTIAGGGWFDCEKECQATKARLDIPTGNPALDKQGNVYFADTGHHRIRMIAAHSGMLTTVAGNGQEGFAGDGPTANAP